MANRIKKEEWRACAPANAPILIITGEALFTAQLPRQTHFASLQRSQPRADKTFTECKCYLSTGRTIPEGGARLMHARHYRGYRLNIIIVSAA